ncbi:carbonic anhydrase 4-like [Hemicordylus capensis]|uniref:carbonic anhydrase 4-like n=1 Tax=Hemicordylus capensis TaxID=884348 RepID=UPI0023043810|nr:carbonic anhydrase 4-like [Hemicordylus capensis]
MALMWVQGAITVTFLLSGGCYASSEGAWCYNDHHCGPETWHSIGHCNGKKQSPIDIVTSECIHNSRLGPVTLTGYDDSKKLLEMKNNGKTVEIELGEGLHLHGYGLSGTYTAKAFHLHWGNGFSRPGAEHYVNGKRYSMELHIVHTKNNMNISEALKDPEGIAVLGFFLDGSDLAEGKAAESWKSFTENLKKVSKKGEDTELEGSISLEDLTGETHLDRYYRYLGSLTTPNCNEVVIWTIFAEPIEVPFEVVEAFPAELHSTNSSNGPHLQKNYRPLQELGERKVEASAALKDSAASLGLQQVAFLNFVFTATLASFLLV